MRDVSQTSCSSSSTGGQEGQGHPWKQRLRRNTTPGTPQTPALGTRGQHPKTPRAGTGPEPGISPLDSNNIPELPQLRLLSLGRSRRKKTLPSFRCIPQNAQDRGTPRPSSVRTLGPCPGLLMPPLCLYAPLMPPCPLPVPVPLTGSPEPARAPQHRPQPQQRHPRATRAARMRCPAAPARGTPGARVPPRRTTAPMVQRGRAPRPLAAVAAPTGWVGTIAAPGTRRRVREAPEPGEHGGARLTRASPARDRRVSGRASDGHHRSQVLRPQQPSALHLSPHSVPAALVPCPSIAADGRYRSVRCPTGGPTVVGE